MRNYCNRSIYYYIMYDKKKIKINLCQLKQIVILPVASYKKRLYPIKNVTSIT